MRLVVLGVLALALGAWLLRWGADRTRAARASATWPTTEGVVVRSEVVRHGGSGGRNSHVAYEADVRYRYAVAGRPHESRTIAVGVASEFAAEAAASAVTARYPVGRTVRVHYDPRDPAESCLVPGVDPGLRIAVASLWALPLLGVGLVAAGRRSMRRQRG